MFRIKYSVLTLLLVLLGITGCSTLGTYQSPRPVVRSLPQIPEIKRQAVVRPRYIPRKQVTRKSVSKVNKYSVRNPKPQISMEEEAEQRERFKAEAKKRATVDIDPYASIPESSSASNIPSDSKPENSGVSPAVKSLLVGARADIAIGRTQSAVSKLERGLRIESQNAQLWHYLAKAHYIQSDYQQTISMAKKSIRYSGDDAFIAQNWELVKQAGERSGDATAVKEALDYTKLNP